MESGHVKRSIASHLKCARMEKKDLQEMAATDVDVSMVNGLALSEIADVKDVQMATDVWV